MQGRASQCRYRGEAARSRGSGQGHPAQPRDVLVEEFAEWLRFERGLAPESVRCYRSQAAKLLATLADSIEVAIAGLDAAAGDRVRRRPGDKGDSIWSAKAQVTGLRARCC